MHPYHFHIGHLLLPTYGLLVAAGLIAALWLSLHTAARVQLSPDALWSAGLFTVISAFLLSRLLLVLFNLHNFVAHPILLLMVPSLTPTGVLLTGLASLAYLRIRRIPVRPALDAWAPCATLLWVFLALAHLAERSDLGLPTTSRLLLRLPFVSEAHHPVGIYAALCALVLTALLLRSLPQAPTPSSNASLSSSPGSASTAPRGYLDTSAASQQGSSRTFPGRTAALALLLTGITQFLLTFFRQPVDDGILLDVLLDPIQWIALGMIVAGTLLYLTGELPPQRSFPHAL